MYDSTDQVKPLTQEKHPTHLLAYLIVFLAVLCVSGIVYAFAATDLFIAKDNDPYAVVEDMVLAFEDVESYETVTMLAVQADVSHIVAKEKEIYKKELAEYEAAKTLEAIEDAVPDRSDDFGLGGRLGYRLEPRPGTFTSMGIDDTVAAKITVTSQSNADTEDVRAIMSMSIDSPFVAATLNMRMLEETTYVQLSDISAGIGGEVSPLAGMDMFLQPFMSTWIAFSLSDVSGYVPIVDEAGIEASQESFKEKLPELRALLLETRPFIFESRDAPAGQIVYAVDINTSSLESFLHQASVIMESPEIRTSYQIDTLIDTISTYQEEYGDKIEILLTIDKKTKLPVSMQAIGVVTTPEDYATGLTVDVDIDMLLSIGKYDEPFVVNTPDTFVTVEELMNQFMGGAMIGGADSSGSPLEESRKKARDSKRLSDLKQLQTAFELYYTDNNAYPVANDPVALGEGDFACLNVDGFGVSGCALPYMGMIPSDSQEGYSYWYVSEADSYSLYAFLETDVASFDAGVIRANPSGIDQPTDDSIVPAVAEAYATLIPAQAETVSGSIDTDGDSLPDDIERRIGTDPNNIDTDGDGYDDGTEYNNGYDPLASALIDAVPTVVANTAPVQEAVQVSPSVLTPPAVPVASKHTIKSTDHVYGNAAAEVVVFEYSDLSCPFCSRFHSTMNQIVDNYDGDVAWVYRHFPLESIHPHARLAAHTAECYVDQGGDFWTFADTLYARHNGALKSDSARNLATDLSADMTALDGCNDSGMYDEYITASTRDAQEAGARGTPYSVVVHRSGNSMPLSGAQPYAVVSAAIDSMLE